jgi:hypothetical protein
VVCADRRGCGQAVFSSQQVPVAAHTVQYAGRVPRPFPGKTTAEVHADHDIAGILAHRWRDAPPATPASASPPPNASLGSWQGPQSRGQEACAYVACRPSDTELNPHGLQAGGGSPASDVGTSARCLTCFFGLPPLEAELEAAGLRLQDGRMECRRASSSRGAEPVGRRPVDRPCRPAGAARRGPSKARASDRRPSADIRTPRAVQVTPQQARPPDPVQTGVYDGAPGPASLRLPGWSCHSAPRAPRRRSTSVELASAGPAASSSANASSTPLRSASRSAARSATSVCNR